MELFINWLLEQFYFEYDKSFFIKFMNSSVIGPLIPVGISN